MRRDQAQKSGNSEPALCGIAGGIQQQLQKVSWQLLVAVLLGANRAARAVAQRAARFRRSQSCCAADQTMAPSE
jgi:hypothetical protein